MAKISPPLLPEVMERPRLVSILDAGLCKPIVWISGPPGAGKTTLIAKFIASRSDRCLWYQADAGDADLATFLRYVCEAAECSVGWRPPNPPLGAGESRLAEYLIRIFREWLARAAGPFFLVVDNLQEIPPDAAVYAVLARLADELPRGSQLLLISRSLPHPVFSQARVRRQILHISWNELKASDEEAEQILDMVAPGKVEARFAAKVAGTCQGWIAGIILMAEGAISVPESVPLDPASPLFDYLAIEVFSRMDVHRRLVLLKTAFLPTMQSDAVRYVTEDPVADAVLEGLTRENFFITRRPPGAVFEYHPLFRSFLSARAKLDLSASELTAVKRRSAIWLADHDDVEAALLLFRDVGEWDAVAEVIDAHASDLVRAGRHRALAAWLALVPATMIQADLSLSFWDAVARIPTNPEGALNLLKRCYDRLKDRNDPAGAFNAWSTIMNIECEYARYHQDVEDWIAELGTLTARFSRFSSPRVECQVAVSILAALSYRHPDHPQIAAWGERAQRLATETNDVLAEFAVCFHRLHVLVFQPLCHLRLQLLEKMHNLVQKPQIGILERIKYYFAATVHASFLGNHRECVTMAQNALELAREWGFEWFAPFILYHLGRHFQNVENFAEADRIADELAALVGKGGDAAATYYYGLTAARGYLRSDSDAAEHRARAALALIGSSAMTWGHVVLRFLLAQVLADLGNIREAREHLAALSQFAERTHNQLLRHHCCLLEARILLEAKDRRGACAALHEGLALAAALEVNYAYIWRPVVLADLLGFALEEDVAAGTARRLIGQRNLRPPESAHYNRAWPRPLEIIAMGGFAILRGGEALVPVGRTQRKPLQLLMAIIALGGGGISVVRLQDRLWPDAEGDAAQRVFDTTLHRLRRLLGVDGALVLCDGRLHVAPELCWIDAIALTRVAQRLRDALACSPSHPPEEINHLARQIAELYRGPFLGDAHEPWAVRARQQIDTSIARLALDLGRHYRAAGDLSAAARWYRRLSDIAGAGPRLGGPPAPELEAFGP